MCSVDNYVTGHTSGMGLPGLLLRASPIRMCQPWALGPGKYLHLGGTGKWTGSLPYLAPVFCQQEPQGLCIRLEGSHSKHRTQRDSKGGHILLGCCEGQTTSAFNSEDSLELPYSRSYRWGS